MQSATLEEKRQNSNSSSQKPNSQMVTWLLGILGLNVVSILSGAMYVGSFVNDAKRMKSDVETSLRAVQTLRADDESQRLRIQRLEDNLNFIKESLTKIDLKIDKIK